MVPERFIRIPVTRQEVLKAQGNAGNLQGLLTRLEEPLWAFIVCRVYLGDGKTERLARRLWRRALDVLRREIRSHSWEDFPEEGFDLLFTHWVKGIADDEVTGFLLDSVLGQNQEDRELTWEILIRREIPEILKNGGLKFLPGWEEDIVMEVCARLLRGLPRWNF